MLIVVVLGIVTVLALIATSFAFRMRADLASVDAIRNLQQARLAAWSGIDRAMLLLRDHRTDFDAWYDNREAFWRVPVWIQGIEAGTQSLLDKEAEEGRPAWRFSIVNHEIEEVETRIRYGLTDEAAKVNLNVAPRGQLLALFKQLDLGIEDMQPEQLVDALIDWMDKDNETISINGAESAYYLTLEPAYRAANRPLMTPEELLRVKGFDGRILYGEDYNRNGNLDENEDDGGGDTEAFPPDDGDGELYQGLLPFITVWSWDWNRANDNKFRIPLSMITSNQMEKATEYLGEEIRPEILEFIAQANARGYEWQSVGELLELEVYEDGTSNYTEAWKKLEQEIADADEDALEKEPGEEMGDENQRPEGEEAAEEGTGEEAGDGSPPEGGPGQFQGQEQSGPDGDGSDNEEEEKDGRSFLRRPKGVKQSLEIREPSTDRGSGGEGGGSGPGEGTGGGEGSPAGADPNASEGGEGEGQGKGTPIISPVSASDMEVLLDRLTTRTEHIIPGLINVNTAPAEVLRTVPGLSEDNVTAIVGMRLQVGSEDKVTPAWLVTNGVLDAQTFALVCDRLTARSIQFTIDSVGFADHVRAFRRIQAVVEMRGHLPQIKYYRDISSLGVGYPVWDDERGDTFETW